MRHNSCGGPFHTLSLLIRESVCESLLHHDPVRSESLLWGAFSSLSLLFRGLFGSPFHALSLLIRESVCVSLLHHDPVRSESLLWGAFSSLSLLFRGLFRSTFHTLSLLIRESVCVSLLHHYRLIRESLVVRFYIIILLLSRMWEVYLYGRTRKQEEVKAGSKNNPESHSNRLVYTNIRDLLCISFTE